MKVGKGEEEKLGKGIIDFANLREKGLQTGLPIPDMFKSQENKLREAAKKGLYLIAVPLRRGGCKGPAIFLTLFFPDAQSSVCN